MFKIHSLFFLPLLVAALLVGCGGGGTDPASIAEDTQNFTASTTALSDEVVNAVLDPVSASLATTVSADDSGLNVSKMTKSSSYYKHPTLKAILDKPAKVHPKISRFLEQFAVSSGYVRIRDLAAYQNSQVSGFNNKLVSLEVIDTSESCVSGELTVDISPASCIPSESQPEPETDNCTLAISATNCVDSDGNITLNGDLTVTTSADGFDFSTGDPIASDGSASATMEIVANDFSIKDSDTDTTFDGTISVGVENQIVDGTYDNSFNIEFSGFTAVASPITAKPSFATTATDTTLLDSSFAASVTGVTATDDATGLEIPQCANQVTTVVIQVSEGDGFQGTPAASADAEYYFQFTQDDNCTNGTLAYAVPVDSGIIVFRQGSDASDHDVTLLGTDPDATSDDAELNIEDDDCSFSSTGAVETSGDFAACDDYDYDFDTGA